MIKGFFFIVFTLLPITDIAGVSYSESDKVSSAETQATTPSQGINQQNTISKLAPADITFSQKEQQWIADNPTVIYSDINWDPFVNVENGVNGIGKDLLDLVSLYSGIQFQYIKARDRGELAEMLDDNRIFLNLAAGKDGRGSIRLDYSEPYIQSPIVMVSTEKYSYLQDISQLSGLSVAVSQGTSAEAYIREQYPDIRVIPSTHNIEDLVDVSSGKLDVFIGSLVVVAHHLRREELYNLRISGNVDKSLAVHFVAAKGRHPELISIINKSLQHISIEKKRTIANNWFIVNYPIRGVDIELVMLFLAIGISVVLLSLLWVRRLQQQIVLKELMESALRSARADAELASKAKSEFLANMSHEIRTPMNAIVGFSQLLEESKLDIQQKGYLQSIKVGSSSLLHIINDILDLSKIEAGKIEIACQPTELKLLLDELTMLFIGKLNAKGVALVISVESDFPRNLYLDGNRVRQIIMNLLSNAQKFTEQGSVNIRVSYQSTVDDNAIQLQIDIEDTGIGIDEVSLQKLFTKFEQGAHQSTVKYGGTGLGLAISKKLAQKMAGNLTATSQLGKGSCFTLRLNNVKVSDAELVSNVNDINYNFNKAVILVVDDVETNCILLRKYLQKYPFKVHVATNGAEAVAMAKEYKPDLILMDLRMPVMDGYEATIKIKQQQTAKVIALTASALEDKESIKKREVFDAFLRKPILRSKLIRVMADFLPHKSQLQVKKNKEYRYAISDEIRGDFSRYITGEFLPKIAEAKKSGQFQEILILAGQFEKLAEQHAIDGLVRFSNDLVNACNNFDVEKIDYLIAHIESDFKDC